MGHPEITGHSKPLSPAGSGPRSDHMARGSPPPLGLMTQVHMLSWAPGDAHVQNCNFLLQSSPPKEKRNLQPSVTSFN